MQFANPQYFWLFLIFIPIIIWYILKQRNAQAPIAISSMSAFSNLPRSYKEYLRHFLFILRLLVISCVIVILARPQTNDSWSKSETEGIDIVIALDVSSSMLAQDFKPDRFEAAKEVASNFVAARETDNIGLVIFAGEAFTAMPMSTNRNMLINYINNMKMGMLEDGTAMGMGLATAINRIKDGKAKSKSIILITDGVNNAGTVSPNDAAEIARDLNIRVYTIGVGTNSGSANYPVRDQFGRVQYVPMKVEIDEKTLEKIATTTGGKYYRANNKQMLSNIFDEINSLEKTKMDVQNFSHTEDNYMFWAWMAIGFFLFELILRYTILKTNP